MAEATVTKKTRAEKPKTASPEAPKSAPKRAPEASQKGKETAFAVISTGGKQYHVRPGQRLKIEKILGDHKEGDAFVFKNILLKGDGDNLNIGTPFVTGNVQATIVKIGRHKTVDVIKYKQKSRYFKKYGHRQPYFEVRIDSIN